MKKSWHLLKGGQSLQKIENNYEQKKWNFEIVWNKRALYSHQVSVSLKEKQLRISKNQIELNMNYTEIMVCANDDNLNTTNHGAMIQEVLISCKAYDVEMKVRKLRRWG